MGKAERMRKKREAKAPKHPSQDRETVKILDARTGKVGTIPGRELATGMGLVEIDSREKNWMNFSELQRGVIQHPPLDEATRAHLGTIQKAFADVHALTLEQWEEGFRMDRHPHSEIAIWLYLAEVYELLSEHKSSVEKREIFSILLHCSNGTPRKHVLTVASQGALSRSEGEKVMDAFYENAPSGAIKAVKVTQIRVEKDKAGGPL